METLLQELTLKYGPQPGLEETRVKLRSAKHVQNLIDQATKNSQYSEETWDTLAEYITEGLKEGMIMQTTTVTTESTDWKDINDRTTKHVTFENSEPHPGNRISGPRDQESDKENHDPEDRALTPEELAIDTPPASPKLVRQNATLSEEEPQWYKYQRPQREKHQHKCPSHPKKFYKKKQKKDALFNDQQALHIYDEPN